MVDKTLANSRFNKMLRSPYIEEAEIQTFEGLRHAYLWKHRIIGVLSLRLVEKDHQIIPGR